MDADTALNGGTANAALNGAQGRYQQAMQQVQGAITSEQKAEQPSIDRFRQTEAQPMPAFPALQKPGATPDAHKIQQESQPWITAISALAALVGSRGRARGTGALKAYAGGLKGIQEGNQQAFENSYKKWKADTDAMMEDNKIEMEKYKSIIDNREMSEAEAMNEFKIVAAQHQNQTALAMENLHQAAAFMDSMEKAKLSAQQHNDRIDEQHQWWKEQQEYKETEKLKPSITQDTADFAADQMLAGDKSGLSNYGRGEKATANLALIHETVQRRAKEKGITGDQLAQINASFAGLVSGERAVGTAGGKIMLAANSLDRSLPLLENAMKKVDLTRFKNINSLENYARTHTGDTGIVSLNTALQTTVTDYSTLIARNGQRTDATDAAAKALANTSMSTGQLQAFIDQVKLEKTAQLSAVKDTKDELAGKEPSASGSSGGAPSDVDPADWEFMSPEQRALWQTPSQ